MAATEFTYEKEDVEEFTVEVRGSTERAVFLFFTEKDVEECIPKSLISDESTIDPNEPGTAGTVYIARWVAKERGLI